MTDKKEPKRRIEARVSQHLGARFDRLAKEYRTSPMPGASIKTTDALHAVLFVGIEAEEKRLGLPPLPELPAPESAKPAKKRRTRKGARARGSGGKQ